MKSSSFYLPFAIALAAVTSAGAGGYTAPTVETPIEVLPTPVAPLTWQGAYVGGTLGYAFGGDDEVGIGQGDTRHYTTLDDKLELSGVNYGLRLGFRGQRNIDERFDWVFAGELGYEAGSIEDKVSDGIYTAKSEINSVLALRIKSGVLNAAKDTWFYGIAGVGKVDFDYSVTGGSAVAGAAGAVNIDKEGQSATGYILGLGVERKMNERLSLTGEWEYHNYGKEHLEDVAGRSTEATPDWHQIKIGLNYQF
ncbi:outer membrane protein [Paracoccus albus]|uniref:outer membrane protein n=1 Tax=Paracoccus albus TaxID=3017784 RepID=UPI0022F0EFE6|nr:outer membrane beta-barrel protein [Paracoccus albus]WBU60360.1 outer membrane beta-barrel protein [Paracoccus albus]